MVSANSAHVMVASSQRVAEMYVVDSIQVNIWKDKEHAALNIFNIKGETDSQ